MSEQQTNAEESRKIYSVLRNLSQELRDIDLGNSVDVVDRITPIELLRNYLSRNKPVLIRGAVKDWPAIKVWTQEYLVNTTKDQLATVALTPDGRADSVTQLPTGDKCFALPEEKRMPLFEFFSLVRKCLHTDDESKPKDVVVPYLQFQNSSLTTELPMLLADVESHWPLATEALGVLPDAVNIWIGTHQSITTWHKDPYENFYAVISGSKTFNLLPPSDVYRMRLKRYPLARWTPVATNNLANNTNGEELELQLNDPKEVVVWSAVEPKKPRFNDIERQEESVHKDTNLVWNDDELPPPLTVTIYPGDMLYLPAYWWHEVHQEGGGGICEDCNVAVNFWYDIQNWQVHAHFKAIEELAVACGLNESL